MFVLRVPKLAGFTKYSGQFVSGKLRVVRDFSSCVLSRVTVTRLLIAVILVGVLTIVHSSTIMDNHDHHMHMMNDSGMSMTTADPHAGHNMDHGSMDHGSMDHSNMDHGSAHGDVQGHEGMMMYFHLSQNSTILFSGWQTDSWQTMLGSCIGIFIMAALYEGLKVFREHLLRSSMVQVTYGSLLQPENREVESKTPAPPSVRSRMLSLNHFIQTSLHVLQVVISYFLMLIFMTYNVYLCLAVAIGAGTGYFLFSWRRAVVVDINEHCH